MLGNEKLNERERSILRSAYQVFTEKGYHNAKVSEIAELAGVGKGTIYEYFENKEALLRGVIQVGMLFYIQEIQKHIDESQSFWNQIENIFKAHVHFLNEHSAFKKVIGDHFSIINKEFHDWLLQQRNHYLSLMENLVEEGIKSGELANQPIDWTAKYILASLNGFNDCQDTGPVEGQVEFILSVLKNGLQVKK